MGRANERGYMGTLSRELSPFSSVKRLLTPHPNKVTNKMRVRLSFDPLIFPLRCWYEIPVEASQNPFRLIRIQDLLSILIREFDIQHKPEDVYLEIDSFELLPSGNITGLIKENDLLCVRLRGPNSLPIPSNKPFASGESNVEKPESLSVKKVSKTTADSEETVTKRKSKQRDKSETPKKLESRKRRKIEETKESPKKKKEKGLKQAIKKVKDKIKKVKSSHTKDTEVKGKETQPAVNSIVPADSSFKPELGILEPPVKKVDSITHVINDTPIGDLNSTLNMLAAPSPDTILLNGKTPTQARNARKRKKRQLEKLERNMLKQDLAQTALEAPSINKPHEFYENPSASLVKNKKKGFLKEMLNTPREHLRFDEPVIKVEAEAEAEAVDRAIPQSADVGTTQTITTPQNPHISSNAVSSEPKPLSPPRVYHSTVELGFDSNQSNRKNRRKSKRGYPESTGFDSPSSNQVLQEEDHVAQPISPAVHQISNDQPVVVALPDEGPRNYTILQPLANPKPGDFIAYKILEMTASYTPEISDYKEATVISFDHSSNSITLKLSPHALKINQGDWDGVSARKFELQPGSDDEFLIEGQQPLEEITLDYGLLIDPRKIPQNH